MKFVDFPTWHLVGGNSNSDYLLPRTLGKWSKLTYVFFQMDWFNHQIGINILREPQHTPGAYPRHPQTLKWKEFLHKQMVEGLGYVPGVCWKILWNMNRPVFLKYCPEATAFGDEQIYGGRQHVPWMPVGVLSTNLVGWRGVFSYEELRMKDYIGWGVAHFWKNIMNMFDLHPRKLRMEKQRWMKMYLLLKMVCFKSRVSFQGCMYTVFVSYLTCDRCDYLCGYTHTPSRCYV